MITLILGGARSGKSELAERLVTRRAGSAGVTYVATGTASDAAMAARIDAHRRRRPAAWSTVEAGAELPTIVRELDGLILLDAVGTWVAATPRFDAPVTELCTSLRERRGDSVVVSDEVGLGVHPSSEAGRQFRDALGAINQALAEVAQEAFFVVAGRALPLVRL